MYDAILLLKYILFPVLMYSMTLYLEVSALWSAELLQVEVEHRGNSDGHLRSQEGLLDILGEVMEGGHCLCG